MDTMTVKEVADVMKVNVKTIQRMVKKLFPETIKQGVLTRLNEIQVTAIKLKLDKNYSIDTGVDLPKTDLEKELIINQALMFQQEKIKKLQNQLKEAQPKIDFFNTVTLSTDVIDMKDVSKILNIPKMGRNKLFQFLRDNNILLNNNTPYQRHVDAGYFKIIENTWTDKNGETHISLKTVVFQKGVDFIRKLLNKKLKPDNQNLI